MDRIWKIIAEVKSFFAPVVKTVKAQE